jgi:hypothetical protein
MAMKILRTLLVLLLCAVLPLNGLAASGCDRRVSDEIRHDW